MEDDDLIKPKKNISSSETTFLAGTKDLPQSTRIEEEEEIILLDWKKGINFETKSFKLNF